MLKSIKASPDICLMVMIFAGFFALAGILIVCENIFWEPKRAPQGFLAHVDLTGTEGIHLEIGEIQREAEEASKSQEQRESEAWANQA